MPNYDPFMAWDDDEQNQEDSWWDFHDYPGAPIWTPDDPGAPIWTPDDPGDVFSPTMPERRNYRAASSTMASSLGVLLRGFGNARGGSGFGASYEPPSLGWDKWGSRARVSLGVWGHDQGLGDPFPILGGAIITPTIDVYTRDREQQFDEYGRALNSSQYRASGGLGHGRFEVSGIMRRAGERGQQMYSRLLGEGVGETEARAAADRAARASVRAQTASFPREDFGQRWSWTYGLRQAMAGSANIRLNGDYGVGPRDLFQQIGSQGYFTRSSSPSEDIEHPERGSWQAYSLDSLYALGWMQSSSGGFITGTSKPDKRRQLGVQRLAMPAGAEAFMRTGRLTGDRMLTTTAVFLENYPYSEGSGVVDPALVQGFTDFRPRAVERPTRAGDDWKVRFGIADEPGVFGKPGEDVFLGEQFVEGKWQGLEPVRGIPGVQQRLFGWRETQSGYQALIERTFPFESGTTKLMHHGMKALLFQSAPIIERMQQTVALAKQAGVLPGDVAAPRMVLPMSKDWLQTYRGMFDFLPDADLRAMGVPDDVIQAKDWQKVGPGVVDKLARFAQERRFTFQQQYEVPVSRLGAFENAGNIVGGMSAVEYLTKGGEQFARFTAEHTGYALPIAAGFRMEYPGKAPMYSPEELMQLQRMFPQVAERLARGNPTSRIWGTAVAAAEGVTPEGAISHEALPWVSARLNVEGSFDDEGTARTLVASLAREMRARKQTGAIVGPGGVLLPNPGDVLSQSILGYSGQEQSQFVSSYVQAMKLLATGGDATDALKKFSETLQTFASGHNVRREALGARLDRAIEGTFTSHMALPDDVAVAGDDALLTLAGIRRDDPEAAEKLTAFVQRLEEGEAFYALGTRRPVSDMFNQLGVPMRVISERMANSIYGAEIENLGRSFAVSPTMAAAWRGDVDADRALLHAVTQAKFESAGSVMGLNFATTQDVLDVARGQTLMARQVQALKTHAPDAYARWFQAQGGETQLHVWSGLQGDTSVEATRALSRALHGVEVDWNESAKWSQELRTDTGKNLPQNYAYYADPANGTVFSREQMLGKFEQTAKSKMLMGRAYNRYLRGLTAMAETPEELQAAVTLASNIYQKALDNQKMTKGELALFNMMESIGPTGAMFDKFDKEEGYVSSAYAGGPAGMAAMLASAVTTLDAPGEALGLLFSRDPAIAEAIASGGSARQIIDAITAGGNEVVQARAFLEDPSRAGILPQMVQAMHFSKASMADVNLNPAQSAYAAQGQRIRAMIRVLGRSGTMQTQDALGRDIEIKGLMAGNAAADIRNMAGLDSLRWWRQMAAERMGLPEQFFASEEDVLASLPSWDTGPGGWDKTYIPRWTESLREREQIEGFSEKGPTASILFAAPNALRNWIRRIETFSIDDDRTPEVFSEYGGLRYAVAAFLPKQRSEPRGLYFNATAMNNISPSIRREIVLHELGHSTDDLAEEIRLKQISVSLRWGGYTLDQIGGDLLADIRVPYDKRNEALKATHDLVVRSNILKSAINLADLPEDYLNWLRRSRSYRSSIDFMSEAYADAMALGAYSRGHSMEKERLHLLAKGRPDLASLGKNIWNTLFSIPSNGSPITGDGSVFIRGERAIASFNNPALPGEEFPAYISEKEAAVLEGLRQMPVAQAQQIAAAVSRPPRYTPKGGAPSFDTGPAGWDKLARSQQEEILRMRRHGASDADIIAKMQEFIGLAGATASEPGSADMPHHWQTMRPDVRQALYDMGYGRSQVEAMTPKQARAAAKGQPTGYENPMYDRPGGPHPNVFSLPDLSPEQYSQFEGMVGKALGGVIPDPTTFLGGLTEKFMTTVREKGEFDVQSVPAMLPIFQQLMGYGDELEVWQRMYGTQNMQTRIKLMPQGLKGMGRDLLVDMVSKGLTEGYTPEVMAMMERGYKHAGIGQGMVRSVRDIIDPNLNRMDMKGAWGMWEDIQKVKGAVGEDAPEALLDRMGALNETMARLTEVETQRVEQTRAQLQADPRYQAGMDWAAGVAGAWKQGEALSTDAVKRLKALRSLQERAGQDTGHIDEILMRDEQDSLFEMAGFGAQGRPGRAGGLFNRMLGRGSGAPELGAGAIENMFTELTLGWTAFRARMAWNLATGAQRGWMDSFLAEENAAVGAALAGGATPGIAGASSQYLSAGAAIANTKAQLGQGVAQVYTPLMSGIGGMQAAPSLGALATVVGTPLGVGSVLAMGTQMVGRGIESAALTGAAGPVGLVAAGVTGSVLGTSYLTGLGENWMQAPTGSFEQTAGRAIRPAQIWAEQQGLPAWLGTLIGMGTTVGSAATKVGGPLALLPDTSPGQIYQRIMPPEVMRAFALEGTATQPGTLQGDVNGLRDWAQTRYRNRVPVESALQMASNLFQITGTTAQQVYEGKAPEFELLMDRYVSYMEGGASPESLYTAQTQTLGYAGVPVGPQAMNWMLQFAQNVPGQERQMYEQAYRGLSALPSTLGRPTTEAEARQVMDLTARYGSLERAVSEVQGATGVGWFTSAFGVESGSSAARMMGAWLGTKDLPAQDTAQRLAGMTSQSFARAGISAVAAAAFLGQLGQTSGENVLGVSNLIVQAESVSLQTGQDFLSLVNRGLAQGYDTKSLAEQRWFMASQAGISGLAPSAFVQGTQQARGFDQIFDNLPVSSQASYQTAAGLLNQVMPRGYTSQQLTNYSQMLLGGMSVPELGLGLQALTGRAGLATSFGIPAASPMAQMLETATVGFPGGLKMTQDQVRGLAGMLSPSAFQYMPGRQAMLLGPSLGNMFMDMWRGDMSPFEFGLGVEAATGSTPWGYSAQRGFGPGSLTDSLGRPYGMYEEWTATAGRQAGRSFAPLFDLQMNAAYASLGAQSAALPIEHRMFERQQAAKRFEWGTGPFTPLGDVQSAIFEGGTQVGPGMQIGDTSIGLVQQEAAIRKQMWQENLQYQLQSIQFQRQALEISKQELALSKEQYQAQREHNIGERDANRGMQLRQREWSAEDFSLRIERMGISQQWTMEDLQRSRRYATGRERVDIERQIQRTMLTQGWEQDDATKGRNRELEVQRFQDQRYDAAVKFEQKLHELQLQRFSLQEQRLALQEQQLAAQEAHLNAQAVLQAKLQKIDEERFQFQYDQMQANMKDEETLEKLKQDARRAEMAYQAAQLANAETLRDAEEKFAESLKGIKEGGVLDKWIEFFNAIRVGPPTGNGGGDGSKDGDDGGGPGDQKTTNRTRLPEMGVGRELAATSQPTIVNFVLDGEVVFSALVKPERLRPVVEEINRRGRLR